MSPINTTINELNDFNVNINKKLNELFLENTSFILNLLNALPSYILILDSNRQIVFANQNLNDFVDVSLGKELGQRIGDVLGCIHSKEKATGCGTSESCQLCGANNVVLKCQSDDTKFKGECRILAKKNNQIIAYDFSITASPLYIKSEQFTLVAIDDISSAKRKKNLEKVFFQDILNTATSINGLTSYLTTRNYSSEFKDIAGDLVFLGKRLIDEVAEQRDYFAAESGELKIVLSVINSSDLVSMVKKQFLHNLQGNNAQINISDVSEDFTFISDLTILRRLLHIMLKNAYEANKTDGIITIGHKNTQGKVFFWVHNNSFIDENTKLQIFQRNFSTKGANRGIGTYILKLLSENYLNGKVTFTSTRHDGTTFTLVLPELMN